MKRKNQLELISKERIGIIDEAAQWGHGCMIGKTGYGKGVCGQVLCEQAYLEGKKVLVWDMFRAENVFFPFPEDNKDMVIKNLERGRGSIGFPTEVLLPVFQREGTKKISYVVPKSWVPSKISYKNLTKSEIEYLMGKTTEKAEQILDNVDFAKFSSLVDLQIKFLELANQQDALMIVSESGMSADIGDKRIYRTINRAIASLVRKNIVASKLPKGYEFIDLEKIQANPKVITCITGRACGSIENFLTVFFNVMSGIIYGRLQESGKYASMVIYIPEVSNIAGATSEDSVVRRLMRTILQESRDAGIEIILDTQRPQNIDASVKGQITKWYIFNLNREDVEYMDKNLVEVPRDYNIDLEIPNQGVGVCTKLWQDRTNRWCYRKASMIFPPQSHKKEAYEDVNKFHIERGIKTKKIIDVMGDSVRSVFASEMEETKEKGESEEQNKKEGREDIWSMIPDRKPKNQKRRTH